MTLSELDPSTIESISAVFFNSKKVDSRRLPEAIRSFIKANGEIVIVQYSPGWFCSVGPVRPKFSSVSIRLKHD